MRRPSSSGCDARLGAGGDGCVGAAARAATSGVLTGYALTTWAESEDGPFGAIAAIAQDADGYLWIGTSAGLFRFDGVRFTPGTASAPRACRRPPSPRSLVGRDGRLWVGLDNGAGVAASTSGRSSCSIPARSAR